MKTFVTTTTATARVTGRCRKSGTIAGAILRRAIRAPTVRGHSIVRNYKAPITAMPIHRRRPLGLGTLWVVTSAGFGGAGQRALGVLALRVVRITRPLVIGVGEPLAYAIRVALAAPMRYGARCIGMAVIGAL